MPCFSSSRVISSSSIGSAKLGADLVELVEHRLLLLDAFHHVAANILGRIELGLLRQKPDPGARQGARIAQEILVHPGHDPEQGRLARAVPAQHADLGAGEKRQVNALEDLAGRGHDLSKVAHREDVFAGHRVGKIRESLRACEAKKGRPSGSALETARRSRSS